jgi:hypothetical protein
VDVDCRSWWCDFRQLTGGPNIFVQAAPRARPRAGRCCFGTQIPTSFDLVSPDRGATFAVSVDPPMASTARLARASALHLDTPPTDVTGKPPTGSERPS